jgi:hypothetical protein
LPPRPPFPIPPVRSTTPPDPPTASVKPLSPIQVYELVTDTGSWLRLLNGWRTALLAGLAPHPTNADLYALIAKDSSVRYGLIAKDSSVRRLTC